MTGGSWSLRDPAPKIAIKEQVCVQHWTSGVDGGLPTVRVTLLAPAAGHTAANTPHQQSIAGTDRRTPYHYCYIDRAAY